MPGITGSISLALMKRSLIISLILSSLPNTLYADTRESISVDNDFVMLEDKDSQLNADYPWFSHQIGRIETGVYGGTLNIMYDGQNAAAKSITSISRINGAGNLVLEGTSTNTVKLFRLADDAADDFYGNLTMCNYSASWDGAGLYDNAAILETGNLNMMGSISLDVAGYCSSDTFFIAALGLNGDVCIGGLDADSSIAPAAYVYSGRLKDSTTTVEHAKEFSHYIESAAHTLTIDTGGNHHFNGTLVGELTIIKKGSGTQSFTGNPGSSCTFHALGGELRLNSTATAAEVLVQDATFRSTGDLSVVRLSMQDATLCVSGTLNSSHADFRGGNTLDAGDIDAGSWTFYLQNEHRSEAVIKLNPDGVGSVQDIGVEYNKSELLRGWYQLVENCSGLNIERIVCNNQAVTTRIENNALYCLVADGELTLPRSESAHLVWLPASGTWQVHSGHSELIWSGPDTNSNFLNGDSVEFNQAADVSLVGELLPAYVKVNNITGTVAFGGNGSIGGNGYLLKSGTGSLKITSAHTFTGGTTLEAGTVITSHAEALGAGRIHLKGGHLDMASQALRNELFIQGDAEVSGGERYAGELQLENGTLRGNTLRIQRTAVLRSGEIALELTGSGAISVHGDVLMSAAGSYTGTTTINAGTLSIGHAQSLGSGSVVMCGGALDLAHLEVGNHLQIQGDCTLLHAGNLTGEIDLQSGRLITDSLGNAQVKCSGTASLQTEGCLNLTTRIQNSGTLTLEGTFNLTYLANSLNPQMVDAYGHTGGTSGFLQDSGTSIDMMSGSGILNGTATYLFRGEEVQLNAQGHCSLGARTHYGQYHISSGHQVSVSSIREVAGDALNVVTMDGGKLFADADVTISASNAEILQTEGHLTGTCSDTRITATGGSLQLHFSGDSQLVSSGVLQLRGVISNSGNLTLQGEFDASVLPLHEESATRIGGSSSASGYAHTAAYSVQIVNGGSVNAGAGIIYGTHRLTLGADGWASSGGLTDYSEYLLTGTDTARLSEIQHPALQRILVTGGTFTVDADTSALQASAGHIILENGTLSGTLSGSARLSVTGTGKLTTANTHTGGVVLNNGHLTISSAAALGSGGFSSSGISSLKVDGFTMVLASPIENTGHLLLHGSFDATSLAQFTDATMIDAYGNANGDSGFIQEAGIELQLITGGTINTSGASILLRGENVTPDSSGHISLPGSLHLDTYYITGEHRVSVSDIQQVAGESLQSINMDSGVLTVDVSTDALSATGGLVQVQNAHLGGCMSGSTRVEVLGDAVFRSANTHSGGTTLNSGYLRITHAAALGTGPVYLKGDNSRLNLSNLSVSNDLHLSGTSTLSELENFSGSIILEDGAAATIDEGSVLNLRSGQTLTVAPGGNTIHGHVNLDGGTIVITGGALTFNGVTNFSDNITLDLSQMENLDSEVIILDFPSVYDEELVSIVLPEGMNGEDIIFDPETGKLVIEAEPETGEDEPSIQEIAVKLTRNQRSVYEALLRIKAADCTGELKQLVEDTAAATDAADIGKLMDRVNGAGYTSLINSVADEALAHLQELRNSAGSAHRLNADSKTAVLIHAYNCNSDSSGNVQDYERNSWGGRLMVEQQVDARLCLGLALSNGQTDITPKGDDSHSDTATHLDAYAVYADADWQFMLSAGVAMHEFSLSRRTHTGHSRTVDGVSGSAVSFCAELSRRRQMNETSSIQPFAALQCTSAVVDPFCESGSTAALCAEEQKAALAELSLGIRCESTLAETLILGVQAAMTVTQGDTETELDMHFAGAPGQSFRLSSGERDVLGARLGCSLTLPVSRACMLQGSASVHIQGSHQYLNSQVGVILYF